MTLSLDSLRRQAKNLRRDYELGLPRATERLRVHPPRNEGQSLRHADFLHVIAQEQNFSSWPALKLAAETVGLDRAARQQRLKIALAHGQSNVVEFLLRETPDLSRGMLGVQIALYDLEAVEAALWNDPAAATKPLGPRTPILHLAFSKHIHNHPHLEKEMLAIAELLVAKGADVNDGFPVSPGSEHKLSALYGAIGHANNMVLGKWLLERGANANDGESLYHATELGHHEGLKMLLEHGADPKGTNALLRAMDFHDHTAVEMLLSHGAHADDFDETPVGGETPWVVPALHQAARRMSDQRMIDILLDNGADPAREWDGASAYAFARVYGNVDLAMAIEARGKVPRLSREEMLLAQVADGEIPKGEYIDPGKLSESYRNIVRAILHLPGKLDHIKRLVAIGLEYDRPDIEGLTPVQVAGWEGLPDVMQYFLRLGPDLTHVNGYGGTLLSTIIHGSENNPNRADRDYIACLEIALTHGVALPRRAIDLAGDENIAAFLSDWAAAHPGQVDDGGIG